MVKSDETCWVKLCFEFTDIGTHAVVSVVTNGVSDDANGVDIPGNAVYLQIAKKGNLFALHYSLDGNVFKMVRFFRLPVHETFKVGFVAQSPLGEGGKYYFEDIDLHYNRIHDLRDGN
jgi:regulation of enolase protein 1 (concanavalin A-like superfamily)